MNAALCLVIGTVNLLLVVVTQVVVGDVPRWFAGAGYGYSWAFFVMAFLGLAGEWRIRGDDRV